MPFLTKWGDLMYFAEGKLIMYERMMREIPNHDRKPVKTMKERDCKHCLYFNTHRHTCSREKCVVFED